MLYECLDSTRESTIPSFTQKLLSQHWRLGFHSDAISTKSSPRPSKSLQFPSQNPIFLKSPNLRPQIPSESLGSAQFNHQIAIASTVQRYGFPQSQLHELIQKNRFLSNSSSSDIDSCIKVLLSFGLTQTSLLSILFDCPRAPQLGFVEEWRMALSELGYCAVSLSLVSMVLEHSGRFWIEPKDFRRHAQIMKREFGFSDETVTRVFEELPALFLRDPVDFGRKVEFLISLTFLAFGVEGRLRPLFQEFRDLGVL